MKSITQKIIHIILVLICANNVKAQSTWTKESNFPGAMRDQAANFSIGHYGFVGAGYNGSSNYQDFYKWNQTTNLWSAIASYPGTGSVAPISFAINGHGYVGLGEGSGGVQNDLWRYDTGTNSWTAMASFPGSNRYASDVFVVGHKAYIIGGSSGGPPYFNDVWVYDANANTWKQLGNTPMGDVEQLVAFSIGNHGYVCGGYNNPNFLSACWEYDTTNDSWSTIASLPVPISGEAFVIGSKAYIPEGENSNGTLSDGYVYDTITKSWTTFTNLGANGIERRWSVAFTVGKYGYIATGYDSLGNYLKDLWQYYPCSDSTLTSIDQVTQEPNEIGLFPNPSNGLIHLNYSGTEKKEGRFIITDMTGRIVMSRNVSLSKENIAIDASSLTAGLYLYRIETIGNANLSTGKFVITK